MIDRSHDLPLARQAELLRHQPQQRLLPAAAGVRSRSCDHAADRSSCIWTIRSRAAGCCAICCAARASRSAAGTGGHADAAHGHRGALPPAEHVQAGSRATRSIRICCAAWRSTRPNQVWAMDITYIPMARGFVYLAAVVDWFSRRVLAWRLSITMEVDVLPRGAGGGAGQLRQAGDLQHRSGQPVHQRRLHRPADRRTRSPSAWMAAARGATTSSSSGCGGRSNTRRSICAPTTASARPAPRSGGIWTSTTASGRIRALTADAGSRLLRPAAAPRQPNHGRAPLIDAENLFRQTEPPQNSIILPTEPCR